MTFALSRFSDSPVLFLISDGMVDGPVQTGPTDMVDSHWAYHPDILFFLGLRVRLTEQ